MGFKKRKANGATNAIRNEVSLVLRVPRVELGQSRGRNSLQHLLGEDPEELPADVERLEHRPVLVVALSDKILLEL